MKYIVNDINYDSKFDILYLGFKDRSNSYGDEDIDNIVWLRDIFDESVTGLTIMDFYKMLSNNDERILEVKKQIDFESIIKEIEKDK